MLFDVVATCLTVFDAAAAKEDDVVFLGAAEGGPLLALLLDVDCCAACTLAINDDGIMAAYLRAINNTK